MKSEGKASKACCRNEGFDEGLAPITLERESRGSNFEGFKRGLRDDRDAWGAVSETTLNDLARVKQCKGAKNERESDKERRLDYSFNPRSGREKKTLSKNELFGRE